MGPRMLTVEEAVRLVLERARPLGPESWPLAQASGRVLAADVAADRDSPPFDKALVDGYAVCAGDLAGPPPHVLRIGETILAGQTPTRPLAPGEAVEIMTGAPLPPRADAVVMHERCGREGPSVRIDEPVRAGMNRLERGREMRAGQPVARAGEVLTPIRIGLLAAIGQVQPLVIPAPRVHIVPTGDELVEPDELPGPGQIRNSNAAMLRALARQVPACATVASIARDDRDPLAERLREGLKADALLITGGVSVGQRDLVPAVLGEQGVRTVFHGVRVKPGKPLLFGVGPAREGGRPGTLVFGLPGNPVSGLVGFLLFVRPALLALQGRPPRQPAQGRTWELAAPYSHRGERATYHPARCVGDRLELPNWLGSADLHALAGADGFAVFPPGDREYRAGDRVGFLPIPDEFAESAPTPPAPFP